MHKPKTQNAMTKLCEV